jgi:NAD(P)-dependent dehydrogenase (short-subunit alcohol dehydrogenase family)
VDAEETLEARVALITGAASGIGRAIASRLYAHGWRLALADTRQAYDFGDRALSRVVDVTDRQAVGAFVSDAEALFGGVDLVVPCAGIHRDGASESIEWCDWDQVLAVNLHGCFAVIRAALPGMLRRGGGRIVTISSELGLTGASESAAYCASKGAVIGLTKALAREYASAGILINSVAPGPVATEMLMAVPEYASGVEAERLPIRRYGTPDEIAAVVEALAGKAGTFMVGQVISPNGGAVI